MDSAQYAELFLTESREHVSAINHSLLELEPPPPQAASATLIAKTKSIKPSFKNGDLKVFSSG